MIDAFLPRKVAVPFPRLSRSVVKTGDEVEEGQVLGITSGGAVHSPVPGVVEGMEKKMLCDGTKGWCVNISTKGSFKYTARTTARSGESVLKTLAIKGVINTYDNIHNAKYPLSLAAECAKLKTINTIVVCLCDEDPSVKTTSMLSRLLPNEVKQGSSILEAATGSNRLIFIGESSMKELYTGEGEFVSSSFSRYPSALKMNIRQKIEGLDDSGVLFVDTPTILSVLDAVMYDRPSITSYVYLDGECLKSNGLLRVRIGTPLRALAEQCGGFVKKCDAIIINGLMIGSSCTLDSPIDKYVKSVMFVPNAVLHSQGESECVVCGNCREVCPCHLLPDTLFMYGNNSPLCTGCGLCNSVCPSRLPLVQNIFITGVVGATNSNNSKERNSNSKAIVEEKTGAIYATNGNNSSERNNSSRAMAGDRAGAIRGALAGAGVKK